MALFGKKDKHKNWTDVIKNETIENHLIWRVPLEDFNTNSTVIVMPGEQAVFVNGGVIEQVLEQGTHKLNTQNYPFITRFRNFFTGGVSVFNAVIYFVRTAHQIETLWGTHSAIQVRDKLLGIATKLRARGAYKFEITHAGIFLGKLIGNRVNFLDAQSFIDEYFSHEFQGIIKTIITKALNEMNVELIGIESHILDLESFIQPKLGDVLADYGIKIVKFSIAAIDVDDDELRRKYDEIGIDAIQKIRNAQADKQVFNTLGDDWGRQKSADILDKMVSNPSGGNVAGIGASVGAGIAMGGLMGEMSKQVLSPESKEMVYIEDPVETLKKLKQLLDLELINQEEYDLKKTEVLKKI